MKRLAALTIALVCIGAPSSAASGSSGVKSLVSECTREAARAHERAWRLEPSLRPLIEAHRDLMSAACVRWLSAEKTDVLLAQCLTQAAAGPRHIQYGRDGDPDVERQQELCRKLATLRSQTLVEIPGSLQRAP